MAELEDQIHTRGRILIVDDEPAIGSMLQDVLAEEGFQTEHVGDGKGARDFLARITPDLVLLDLQLPDVQGWEILREIRKKDRELGLFIPVIILTGVYTTRHDKIQSLDSGADDFIQKPFDMVELLARVRSLIRLREMYKRSQYLATHDHLTRCYNRRFLMEVLDREVARFKRHKMPFSFMMIDLDHFKEINDQYGHDVGDQVLVHIGYRLQDFFRAVDTLGRLGGDEFAAILPDCKEGDAGVVGERILQMVRDPAKMEGLPKDLIDKIRLSIGIACVPSHTEDPEVLLRLADQAMYLSKKAGRNRLTIASQAS